MTLFVHEAEQAVIGAVLAFEDDRDRVLERLLPHHFHEGVHQRIWATIQAERKKAAPFDMIAVHAVLASDAGYKQLGAAQYLADMVDRANSWSLDANVDLVLERAARRSILTLANDLARVAQDTSQGSAEAILADFEREAADIAKEGVSRPLAVPVGLTALDMIEAAFQGEFQGSSVGLDCLDHVTGGIRQEDVWFVGGRTSMGKSVLGLSLARGIAAQGRGVMMFSLEMPTKEVQARLIADLAFDLERAIDDSRGANVRYGDILKGRADPHQRDRARHAARQLASLPLSVTDEGGLTINDIRAQAQRQFRAWDKAGVQRGAVLIDHIGLVKPHRPSDSKAAETADTVNELKALAKYLKAPIIALCQVNRNTESRNDKRPTLADLNWSGAIEQIADMICLLYRESYYLKRSSNDLEQADGIIKEHDLELLIHKNRSGPICNLEAYVDVACNVVRDKPDPMRRRA
jgi:replicative DNA helicase